MSGAPNPPSGACTHEQACERVASLFAERWLRHYARSKLRNDPVFAAAYELLGRSNNALLDLGCGVGLLPFYLRERGVTQPIIGIDIDARKVARARETAQAGAYSDLSFVEQNAAATLSRFDGDVAVFDLLHYLSPARQTTLLRELAASVAAGGVLLLRDCPQTRSLRFWMTYAGELFAQTISWNWNAALHFPTAESIEAAFGDGSFTRETQPAWGATPFNNQLFIFRRREVTAGLATESRMHSRQL